MSDNRGPWSAVYSRCKKLIGPTRLGMLDYVLDHTSKDPWGGPFNGQKARQDLFRHLLQACRPAAIIETGTYLGSTAEFMAKVECLPQKRIYVPSLFRESRDREGHLTFLSENDRLRSSRVCRFIESTQIASSRFRTGGESS